MCGRYPGNKGEEWRAHSRNTRNLAMTASLFRGPHLTILAALAVAGGLALVGVAQAGDLDGVRARQTVKAQKAHQLIRALIAEAQKAQSTNPTQARRLFRQALEELR